MKNKIEITDTKENFILNINGYIFNGKMISDYEIKRSDGKNGYKVIVTFIPDALKTNIELIKKEQTKIKFECPLINNDTLQKTIEETVRTTSF